MNITPESWSIAGHIVAQLALDATRRDQFETAHALRTLAVVAFTMSDQNHEDEIEIP